MVFAISISPATNQTLMIGEPILFRATISGENGVVEYEWTEDDVPIGTDSDTLEYTPTVAGDHVIMCTGTDETPDVPDSNEVTVTVKSVFDTFASALSYLSKIAKAMS